MPRHELLTSSEQLELLAFPTDEGAGRQRPKIPYTGIEGKIERARERREAVRAATRATVPEPETASERAEEVGPEEG
jgi:hypothetical protein